MAFKKIFLEPNKWKLSITPGIWYIFDKGKYYAHCTGGNIGPIDCKKDAIDAAGKLSDLYDSKISRKELRSEIEKLKEKYCSKTLASKL